MFQIIGKLLMQEVEKSRILYLNLESDVFFGAEMKDLRKISGLFAFNNPTLVALFRPSSWLSQKVGG